METSMIQAGDRSGGRNGSGGEGGSPSEGGGALRGVERLVVVCPSWVGDCVMATPVLRALREGLPGARITLLLRPGLEELLAGLNWFDDVIVANNRGMVGPLRLAARLRAVRADAALLLPNSFRSAWSVWLSRIPRRIGYDRDGRGWMLTHRLQPPPRQRPFPAIDYYANLGEWALQEAIERRMKLALTEWQRRAGEALLAGVDRPFALLNPGANRPDKRWPPGRFAAVAVELSRGHGLAIVASGGPGEIELIDALTTMAQVPIVNLARRGITLGSLKTVVSRCAVMITNDTGPRHVAVALNRPVVTMFGPTDHRWTTLNAPRERLVLAQPFLPEQETADKWPRECGMDGIAVRDVLHAAEALLTEQTSRVPLE